MAQTTGSGLPKKPPVSDLVHHIVGLPHPRSPRRERSGPPPKGLGLAPSTHTHTVPSMPPRPRNSLIQ